MTGQHPGAGSRDRMADRFDQCPCARLLGMVVVATWPGGARVVMEAGGKENPEGVLHGGAIFALADHAFGLAANHGGGREVALSATIQYLAPATGRLEAVAERVGENGGHALYRVEVFQEDRIVAIFEGVGIRMPPDGGA